MNETADSWRMSIISKGPVEIIYVGSRIRESHYGLLQFFGREQPHLLAQRFSGK
jgi:hypothetical protein